MIQCSVTGSRCNKCENIRYCKGGDFVSRKRKRVLDIGKMMNDIKEFSSGYRHILPKKTLDYIMHTPIPKSIQKQNEWDKYYTIVCSGLERLDEADRNELNATVKQYPFLKKLIEGVQDSVQFRESLPLALVMSVVDRYVENKSSSKRFQDCPPVVMHFFSLIRSINNSAFRALSANTYGPNERSVQRFNAKNNKNDFESDNRSSIINSNKITTINIIVKHIENLIRKDKTSRGKFPSDPIIFSLAIDATKLAEGLQVDSTQLSVVGGAANNESSNHSIHIKDLDGRNLPSSLSACQSRTILKEFINNDSKKRKLSSNTKDVVKLANEVKVALLSFQDLNEDVSPYFPICGRPQTTNAPSDMTEFCCEICLEASKILASKGLHCLFVNTCNDAVNSDIMVTINTLLGYMNGEKQYVATLDLNHVIKALRYHCLTSCNRVVCIGKHFIDVGLLDACNVPSELIRFTDWASDVIVLRLISYDTVCSLIDAYNDYESVGAIVMTIFLSGCICMLYIAMVSDNLNNLHKEMFVLLIKITNIFAFKQVISTIKQELK